jgi:hypothetical protein
MKKEILLSELETIIKNKHINHIGYQPNIHEQQKSEMTLIIYIKKHKDIIGIAYTLNYYIRAYSGMSIPEHLISLLQTTISEIKNLNTNTQILTKNIETLIEKQTQKNLIEDMLERIQSQIKDTSIKAFIEKIFNPTNTP